MRSAKTSRNEADRPAFEPAAWFAGRIPDGWFTAAVKVRFDREEIRVVGELPAPKVEGDAEDGSERRRIAGRARIEAFREETREQRIKIATDAERLWGRKVSWGAECAGEEHLFTTAAVPVMTRLRMEERSVLDTLIEAGVARSRSEALAWCVRLVGEHQADWIEQLRSALDAVQQARQAGPT